MKEKVERYKSMFKEGINIDRKNKIVYLTLEHDRGIKFSGKPVIDTQLVEGIKYNVISIFERTEYYVINEEKEKIYYDGNPLVYALKDLYTWSINDETRNQFFNEMDKVLKEIKFNDYDTLVLMPSKHLFLNEFINYAKKYVNDKIKIATPFLSLKYPNYNKNKIDWDDKNRFIRTSVLLPNTPFRIENNVIDEVWQSIRKNEGYVSMKDISDNYREYVRTIKLNSTEYERTYDKVYNKDILLVDDTMSTGSSISQGIKYLKGIKRFKGLEKFNPKSITIMTIFSKLKKK